MRNHEAGPMNVIVYFRQNGGTAAKDYPVTTHWAEDENGIPAPLFSAFDTGQADTFPPEILSQIEAVNPWLAARRGVVAATFTEIEIGSPRRPAYGAARKAAIHERAVLLVTTSEAVAGQEFSPASQDGVEVITLPAPKLADQLRETASGRTPVVFYLRAGPQGPEADTLLAKQRDGIQKANISDNVLAEFMEQETVGSTERPQLAKALELCRQHKALLFIGTTDAIGDGEEFQPDFTYVSYEVGYRKAYEWPDLIALSACPFPVALHFGKQWVHGNIPLYLANSSGSDFVAASVTSRGSTFLGGELTETTLGNKRLGPVPAGQARLVEAYDVYFEGDFLIEYRIDARLADGTSLTGRAFVKGIPASRWLLVGP
ncbi:protein of unknown function [Pseudorhizobium banfieldiae]|uniref:Uncharacterized protein n=1 Tax=Pseudorhizobium banfieldiae TaxID=1125847 RepID=L0NAJ9_9HYPH|nr:hypothetical protein [Pseudorhizobium banfieldiae]CAD6600139.1 hypothetical protein RNT25_00733 [arsenite-oxidising bacterium NT-25]CCF18053.1 protein of unknown function [Pseudorhizobium banfieldiae]